MNRLTAALATALALLALSGCGGESKDAAATPTSETVTAAAPDAGVDMERWKADLAALGYTQPDMDALLDNVRGMCADLEGERDAGYKISIAWDKLGIDGITTELLGIQYVCPEQSVKMLRSIKETDDYVDDILGQR